MIAEYVVLLLLNIVNIVSVRFQIMVMVIFIPFIEQLSPLACLVPCSHIWPKNLLVVDGGHAEVIPSFIWELGT